MSYNAIILFFGIVGFQLSVTGGDFNTTLISASKMLHTVQPWLIKSHLDKIEKETISTNSELDHFRISNAAWLALIIDNKAQWKHHVATQKENAIKTVEDLHDIYKSVFAHHQASALINAYDLYEVSWLLNYLHKSIGRSSKFETLTNHKMFSPDILQVCNSVESKQLCTIFSEKESHNNAIQLLDFYQSLNCASDTLQQLTPPIIRDKQIEDKVHPLKKYRQALSALSTYVLDFPESQSEPHLFTLQKLFSSIGACLNYPIAVDVVDADDVMDTIFALHHLSKLCKRDPRLSIICNNHYFTSEHVNRLSYEQKALVYKKLATKLQLSYRGHCGGDLGLSEDIAHVIQFFSLINQKKQLLDHITIPYDATHIAAYNWCKSNTQLVTNPHLRSAISEALEQLKYIPGVYHCYQKIIRGYCVNKSKSPNQNTYHYKGYVYELLTALHLKRKHALVGVGTVHIHNNHIIEIDIETSDAIVECKAHNWNRITAEQREAIKEQLKMHVEHATSIKKKYSVYCLNKITPQISTELPDVNFIEYFIPSKLFIHDYRGLY